MKCYVLRVLGTAVLLLVFCCVAAAQAGQGTRMIETKKDDVPFLKALPKDFEMPADDAGKLLLREYGAVYVAGEGVVIPKRVVFRDDEDVKTFQSKADASTEVIGGHTMTLQRPAMKALKSAIGEARVLALSITPRGSDSGARSYGLTVSLWASRVVPGLKHWVAKKRITKEDAKRITELTPYEQVPEILRLEQKGIYFSKDLSKSIIYSVAPPGASQHLAMLALDIEEFNNVKVRAVLAKYGWYQTVTSDLPHFTFLGISETDLPKRGLKLVTSGGRGYWVPDLPPEPPMLNTPNK